MCVSKAAPLVPSPPAKPGCTYSCPCTLLLTCAALPPGPAKPPLAIRLALSLPVPHLLAVAQANSNLYAASAATQDQ